LHSTIITDATSERNGKTVDLAEIGGVAKIARGTFSRASPGHANDE
jgi:hypothetical protein